MISLFVDFVCDRRYGWVEECEQRFGRAPALICHEWNTALHASEFEGRPGRRALTVEELWRFFDHADDQVSGSQRHRIDSRAAPSMSLALLRSWLGSLMLDHDLLWRRGGERLEELRWQSLARIPKLQTHNPASSVVTFD